MKIQNYLKENGLDPIVSIAGNEIIPLSKQQYEQIRTRTTAQTSLKAGESTQAHTHEDTSFYLVKKLSLNLFEKVVSLPEQALVVIQKGVAHPWLAINTSGEVCDVPSSFLHEPHIVLKN